MEVIFRSFVPDNVEHWQVFDDEKQIVRFLNHLNEFENFQTCSKEEGFDFKSKDVVNPTFGNMVAMEQLFDRNDAIKRGDEKKMDPGEFIEVNIGFLENPEMVKISKGTFEEEKENLIDLLIAYRDVLAFSHDELKGYRKDVIEHTIPLKDEDAKPFK